jgi:hypothetical protein
MKFSEFLFVWNESRLFGIKARSIWLKPEF